MSAVSNQRPSLTIGIEEEYQTVDPQTRDLRSHIHAEIVQKGKLAARATDEYVHENPWRAVGIGAGVGLIIGLLIGRR